MALALALSIDTPPPRGSGRQGATAAVPGRSGNGELEPPNRLRASCSSLTVEEEARGDAVARPVVGGAAAPAEASPLGRLAASCWLAAGQRGRPPGGVDHKGRRQALACGL